MNLIKKKRFKMSLKEKKALWGYFFVFPFVIGFLMFFLYPFIQSVLFSVSELRITGQGFELDFVGWANYHRALFVHPNYNRAFFENMMLMAVNIPAIIIFSFFIATVLNQKFKGRLLARIIFFLPVILGAGIVRQLEGADFLHQVMSGVAELEEAGGSMLSTENIRMLLLDMRLPDAFMEYILTAVDRIPQILNDAAIPILIFLAGLQSIPRDLYEAASIEGATAWESFWKITFPMISPLVLTNIIFIIVDFFTSEGNYVVRLIEDEAWSGGGYGSSSAMAWIYFLGITIFLIIVYKVVSSFVFYHE